MKSHLKTDVTLYLSSKVGGVFTKMLDLAVNTSQLSLGLAPGGERSMLGDVLDVDTIVLEPAGGLHLGVLLPVPLGEAPVLGHVDLLTSGKLELGSSQSLNDVVLEKEFEIKSW